MTDDRLIANSGYAMGRLWRALEAARKHPDLAVRERAEDKADKWRAVLEGMAQGRLLIGSRVPVADTPSWVTLEVAHGGFATGRYLAEGALREHEVSALERLSPGQLAPGRLSSAPGASDRARLNLHYLSDAGLEELVDALQHSKYRVEVPEEGALLVVAWLLHRGFETEALALIDALEGLAHRLRFYPRLVAEPVPSGSSVFVQPAGAVKAQLEGAATRFELVHMNATLGVWTPLYERLVALWLDTVEGDAPQLDGDGQTTGGWPARRWASDWIEERDAWLADYGAALREHGAHGRHHHPKSNFAWLRGALERCPSDASALSARDIGRVRRALACTVSKHGSIGGERRSRLRAEQARVAARPTHAAIAHVVAQRLAPCDPDGGVTGLERFAGPVATGESAYVRSGTAIPPHLVRKVERALEAPIPELIERNVIRSGEALAQVLPQITSRIAAAAFDDPVARELYAKIYAAFRRRRSLLLLNLEHQVRLQELPWVRALEPFLTHDPSAAENARAALEEVTETALTAFPHQLLPNPLVREMRSLAKQARLDLPLVEEVAADIFMGTFTAKWDRAARAASAYLEGTLYARYYDLPAVGTERSGFARAWGKVTAVPFGEQCRRRTAEVRVGKGSFVADNGAVLEQSQILTTHNLAVLVDELGLRERITARAPELAGTALDWVVHRHRQLGPEWSAQLRTVKNTAYAWRHAIFFLSLLGPEEQRRLVAEHLADSLGTRLEPAARGLRAVIDGSRFDDRGRIVGEWSARRFLGWSIGRHWILSP